MFSTQLHTHRAVCSLYKSLQIDIEPYSLDRAAYAIRGTTTRIIKRIHTHTHARTHTVSVSLFKLKAKGNEGSRRRKRRVDRKTIKCRDS